MTASGRQALRVWLGEPASFPRIQHEAVVKLLAADLADEPTVRGSLRGLRAEAADLQARLDVSEQVAATLPHRERYLRLVHNLGRRLIQTHLDWLDEVERELEDSTERPG